MGIARGLSNSDTEIAGTRFRSVIRVYCNATALLFAFFLISIFLAHEASATSKLTYHGRIVGGDGTALEGKVEFKVQILDSSESCLLYEEIQTIYDVKNGIFALKIGENASTLSPSYTIEKVFQGGPLTGVGGCSPSPGRKLALSFSVDGGVNWENVPPTSISAIPQAIESKSVGGFGAENLLRVEEGGEPKTAPKFTQAEADELLLLARGQSTRYMRIENSVVTLPSYSSDPMSPPPAGSVWFEGNEIKFSNGTTVITLGSGGGGGGVASVSSGDSFIQVNNTDPANPKVSLNTAQVEAQLSGSFASINDPRFDDAVKKSGDMMTGSLALPVDGLTVGGTQLVAKDGRIGIGTASPSVTLDVAGAIKIGASGSEACGSGNGAGTIRFSGGDIQFCNGSGWQTLGGSGGGGGGGSTPTFAVQTTGIEFKFESIDNDHTLYIPLASTAGATAGLISNADYQAFSSNLIRI